MNALIQILKLLLVKISGQRKNVLRKRTRTNATKRRSRKIAKKLVNFVNDCKSVVL